MKPKAISPELTLVELMGSITIAAALLLVLLAMFLPVSRPRISATHVAGANTLRQVSFVPASCAALP